MKRGRSLLVALGILLASVDGVAQDKEGAFRLRSDQVKRVAEHVTLATGHVEADFNGWHVRADSLEVRNDPAGKALGPVAIIAEGGVVFERGDERLRLRRLEFDPRTGRGVFELQQ